MDEIDAALDVDKVNSLAQVLRKQSEGMQLLIITHKQDVIVRKRTECDAKQQCKQIIGTYYCNNNTHIITATN